MINEIIQGSALENLQKLEADSIDLLVTDPPYGYSFMNKDWDKAVVSADIWRQCLRVLKPGAFAFIMSSPRQDVFCKMMLNLIEAGFRTDFSSIYWTYASGFPKAADVSKLVDKRNGRTTEINQSVVSYLKEKRLQTGLTINQLNESLRSIAAYSHYETNNINNNCLPTKEHYTKLKELLGLDNRFDELIEREEAKREIIGRYIAPDGNTRSGKTWYAVGRREDYNETKPATEQAKKLEGSYAGFQPKPAVELVLVVMKPLPQKSYVDQALDNQKGITWLDSCRIPYQNEQDKQSLNNINSLNQKNIFGNNDYATDKTSLGMIRHIDINDKGRFPANLLVEDDVLNDGKITKSTGGGKWKDKTYNIYGKFKENHLEDGARGLGDEGSFSRYFSLDAWAKTLPFLLVPKPAKAEKGEFNKHPTVKSLKLMSYLITMGSREGDTVLDPFCGSGTVLIAAHELHRKYLGIEISQEYCEIARERLRPHKEQKRIQEFTDA